MKLRTLNRIIVSIISLSILSGCYEEPFDWTFGKDIIVAKNFNYSKISPGSATFTFEIRKKPNLNMKELYIEYKNTTFNTISSVELEPYGEGIYNVELSGLIENMLYQVNVKSSVEGFHEPHEDITILGSSTFKTAIYENKPTIYKITTNATNNSITINGIITQGDEPIKKVNVKYRKSGSKILRTKACTLNGDNFNATIENLTDNTKYEYYIIIETEKAQILSYNNTITTN